MLPCSLNKIRFDFGIHNTLKWNIKQIYLKIVFSTYEEWDVTIFFVESNRLFQLVSAKAQFVITLNVPGTNLIVILQN